MNHDTYDDDYIAGILKSARRIALVGASRDASRPSYGVMQFLIGKGHEVVPVNPMLPGQSVLGRAIVGSLAAIDGQIDMVEVFRRSEAVPEVVRETIAQKDRLGISSVWLQIGVVHAEAAAAAEAAGLKVVMNRCPKIEYPKLGLG